MRLRIFIVERMSTAWKISFGLRWFGGGPVRELPCAGGKNRKVTSAIPFLFSYTIYGILNTDCFCSNAHTCC